MRLLRVMIVPAVLMMSVALSVAVAQTPASPAADSDMTTMYGKVMSSSKNSFVVVTDNNVHQLFVFDRDTNKPQNIPEGALVTVTSVSADEPGLRIARQISVGARSTEKSSQPDQVTEQTSHSAPAASTQQGASMPVAARRLQNEIEREARKFAVGFRTGVGMNPEVLLVGLHARMGPVFHPDITFRPNAEFGFGEVTKLFAVNLEAAYRLPITQRWQKWSVYAGGGPSLGFTHQNFDRTEAGVDFGDLSYAIGMNLLMGIESRKGFFVESKATLWASPNPTFRVLFGWTF